MRIDEVVLSFSLLLSLPLCFQICFAGDTSNAAQNITQLSGGNLVSSNSTFELGFFSPDVQNGDKRYLGIWYHGLEPQTVVWVANRDDPVADSRGVFRIAEDGNAVVEDASKRHWSSGLEASPSTNRTLKLLDSGNLVLIDDSGTSYLWQSFQHPTDTFLRGMKMDANLTLTCWRDATDPAPGDYVFKLGPSRNLVVKEQSQLHWTESLEELDARISRFLAIARYSSNISQPHIDVKSRLLMDSSGEIQFLKWDEEDTQWVKRWSGPDGKCEVYNHCGSFGVCYENNLNLPECKCLPGFKPKDGEGKGCVRKSTSSIDTDVTFLNLTNIRVGDPDKTFDPRTQAECQSLCLNNTRCQAYSFKQKIPSRTSDDSDYVNTCKIWTQNLSTLSEDHDRGNLSVLVKRSDIAATAKSCEPCSTYEIPYPLSTGPNCGDPTYNKFNCNESMGHVSFTMPGGISYQVTWIDEDTRMFYIETNDSDFCVSRNQSNTPKFPFNMSECSKNDDNDGMIKINWAPAPEPPCRKPTDCENWPHSTCRKGENRKRKAHKLDGASSQIQQSLYESERHVKGLIGLGRLEEKDIEGIEVPCYTFASILAATDNFSESNKLGKGGYGPVYKGTFFGGHDIAVKRLSNVSTQGLQEFKNDHEVILIAKLQHRNLVRLRGYCIKGDEKILLYEYMPNKSLDSFIFG
ncbi:unnamed protein product [Sphenostylis stenocarpa]|uniref:non-specific serine/threonine protein kinase n=1 Tax=Sphenostylis stenocarpa TaxID=92480 RepID=A0AA86VYT4_9FABA|nr:unnamed protein product [Sphenostylis stenocarpa]